MFSNCHINRWKISRSFDQDAPLGDRLRQHLNCCETCQQFYEANRYLVDLPSRSIPDDERRVRIMTAIRTEAKRQPEPVSFVRRKVKTWGPPVAAAAVVCLLGIWFWPKKTASSEAPAFVSQILEIPEKINQVARGPYKSELARLKTDLSDGVAFVRSASLPMQVFDRY